MLGNLSDSSTDSYSEMVRDSSIRNLFVPLESKRAFEEISRQIKGLIFKGILKPGDKLPSETELARQFNVGRQTVREALRILELSGFIAIQKGSTGGPVIKDTVLSAVSNSISDAIQMGNITHHEITVARIAIEKSMLNHVIKNADDADTKSLQQNIFAAREKIEKGFQASSENVQFHRLLAQASKNHVFVIVVESIMAVVVDFLSRLEPDLQIAKQVTDYHEALLNAIIEQNIDKAIDVLEKELLELADFVYDGSDVF